MTDNPPGLHQTDRLRDRLVLAALSALIEGDPVLTVEVGENELRLHWKAEGRR